MLQLLLVLTLYVLPQAREFLQHSNLVFIEITQKTHPEFFNKPSNQPSTIPKVSKIQSFIPSKNSQSHPTAPKKLGGFGPGHRPLVEIPGDPAGPGRFIQTMLAQPHTPLAILLLDDLLED